MCTFDIGRTAAALHTLLYLATPRPIPSSFRVFDKLPSIANDLHSCSCDKFEIFTVYFLPLSFSFAVRECVSACVCVPRLSAPLIVCAIYIKKQKTVRSCPNLVAVFFLSATSSSSASASFLLMLVFLSCASFVCACFARVKIFRLCSMKGIF